MLLLQQCHSATASLFSEVNKECVKAPGGKGALMALAAILLCGDGTNVEDKYFAASGLANVGCTLGKKIVQGVL